MNTHPNDFIHLYETANAESCLNYLISPPKLKMFNTHKIIFYTIKLPNSFFCYEEYI